MATSDANKGSTAGTEIAVAAKKNSIASFFSFADPGGYVWWAGVILAALGASCLAAIIVISVKSATRTAPNVVFDFLKQQSCPVLSPLLDTPVTFTAWSPECRAAPRGRPYECYSRVDCVMLSATCAPPALLGLMTCETENATSPRKVCKVNLAEGRDRQALPNGGFCTMSTTSCAWCVDQLNCPTLADCVPRELCNRSASGDEDHESNWRCA